MVSDKEISFEESKLILLEMMDEIHKFCTTHNIRYSLSFGTLLGAIRHRGYIPWDDDVDIMMPLPDLLKFKELFRSDKLKYIDVDTDSQHFRPFSRIAHTGTYHKFGKQGQIYGVCIDLYVVVGLPDDDFEYFRTGSRIDYALTQLSELRSIIAFHSSWSNIPGCSFLAKKLRNHVLGHSVDYSGACKYFNVSSHIAKTKDTIYDRDIFDNLIDVDFEGRKYSAIASYDYFLKVCYGDYMQLPPEEDRHPYHGRHYYWKEK